MGVRKLLPMFNYMPAKLASLFSLRPNVEGTIYSAIRLSF